MRCLVNNEGATLGGPRYFALKPPHAWLQACSEPGSMTIQWLKPRKGHSSRRLAMAPAFRPRQWIRKPDYLRHASNRLHDKLLYLGHKTFENFLASGWDSGAQAAGGAFGASVTAN